MARILAISSHVTRGHVGLCATVPALQHLGHEVWALPTVLLASRPGLGQLVRHELPADELSGMLAALEGDGCWPAIDAVFAGYFPSAHSVAAAATAIGRIKAAKPGVTVFVDPILGDAGRLYVATATAEAIRDLLVPLATIASPNLFELTWLTGATTHSSAEIAAAARRLAPSIVAVTSARETADAVATLLVTRAGVLERRTPRHAPIPNGAGDLLAGLLLGALVNGQSTEAALDASLADLDRVLAASAGYDVLQLSALSACAP
jgi:pyridoxine kinase